MMTKGGGGGAKNLKKLMTSFMNGPEAGIVRRRQYDAFTAAPRAH